MDATERWQTRVPVVRSAAGHRGQKGQSCALRRVYRLTDRTIDNKGNALMLPEYVHERLTNTPGSEIADEQVITLYRNHALREF